MNSPTEKLSLPQSPDKGDTDARLARVHDTKSFHVTLKQWRALHAVVDCGGFSEAAESLHLSQSSISYAIAKLQEQFGFPLLKVMGRKAELTEEGRALLARSRNLLSDAVELEIFADNLRRGRNAEIRMAVDPDFPMHLITQALHRLKERGHDIRLALSELMSTEIDQTLRSRRADLAIVRQTLPGFNHMRLFQVDFVAVAHPQHRLSRLKQELHPVDLAAEIEIVIAKGDQQHPIERNLPAPIQSQRWCVQSSDTAMRALCDGIGYAWLSHHQVRPLLEKGTLCLLQIHSDRSRTMMLHLASVQPLASCARIKLLVDMLHTIAQEEQRRAIRTNLMSAL